MTTIDLACPTCGRVGTVPREKSHSRLVCKKCNRVFHMNTSGKAVPGEPADHAHAGGHDHHGGPLGHLDTQSHPLPHGDHSHPLPRDAEAGGRLAFGVPVSTLAKVAVSAVFLLASFAGYRYFTALPGDALTPRAQAIVEAFARNSTGVIRENASAESVAEAERFYKDTVLPKLEDLRKHSTTRDLSVSVMVLEVNADGDKAQVLGIFVPRKGSSRDEAILEASGTVTPETKTAEFTTWWVKDPKGRWRLDGQKCLNPKATL